MKLWSIKVAVNLNKCTQYIGLVELLFHMTKGMINSEWRSLHGQHFPRKAIRSEIGTGR